MLDVTYSKSEKSSNQCLYCHETTHTLLNSPKRVCKYYRKQGLKYYVSVCYKNPARQTNTKLVTAVATQQSLNQIPFVINNNIIEILKQVLSGSCTAMSATSGNS